MQYYLKIKKYKSQNISSIRWQSLFASPNPIFFPWPWYKSTLVHFMILYRANDLGFLYLPMAISTTEPSEVEGGEHCVLKWGFSLSSNLYYLYYAWKKLKLPKVGKECLRLSFFLWFTHEWNCFRERDWLGVGKDIKEILKFYKNELRL